MEQTALHRGVAAGVGVVAEDVLVLVAAEDLGARGDQGVEVARVDAPGVVAVGQRNHAGLVLATLGRAVEEHFVKDQQVAVVPNVLEVIEGADEVGLADLGKRPLGLPGAGLALEDKTDFLAVPLGEALEPLWDALGRGIAIFAESPLL